MRQAGNGRTAKAIWTPEPILTPERKLWRAVLEQAYEDAELPKCAGTGFVPRLASGRGDICAQTRRVRKPI